MLLTLKRFVFNPAVWVAFIAIALIGIGAEPAHAAVTMTDLLAPFIQLHGGFLTFIQLGCAAAAIVALTFIGRAPGTALLSLVVIVVIYILAVGMLT